LFERALVVVLPLSLMRSDPPLATSRTVGEPTRPFQPSICELPVTVNASVDGT